MDLLHKHTKESLSIRPMPDLNQAHLAPGQQLPAADRRRVDSAPTPTRPEEILSISPAFIFHAPLSSGLFVMTPLSRLPPLCFFLLLIPVIAVATPTPTPPAPPVCSPPLFFHFSFQQIAVAQPLCLDVGVGHVLFLVWFLYFTMSVVSDNSLFYF